MKHIHLAQRLLCCATIIILTSISFLGAPAHAQSFSEQAAPAQEAPATELVIHGAPFTEGLTELPQSATVVQEERFQEKGENSFQYEIESIPNLTWSGGTSEPRFFIIRGVGELEQYTGAPNPSVATIIDGIDFSGLGIVTPMFDIEQVEVLRGPQGIRFGSSALAGALNVLSNDPTEYTTGHVRVMGGNDELGAGGVAVGGAVPGTDNKLQLRFSAFNTQSDGFRNNVYLNRDDTNKRDESMARLKLRYEASGDLSFDLAVWGVEANNGYDAFAIDNSFTTQSDRPGKDSTAVRASSFTIHSRPADDLVFESISTIARTSMDYSYDGDWGNNPFWEPYAPYDYFSDQGRTRRVLGEELRLRSDDVEYVHGESWRWLSGIYTQRLTEDTSTTQYSDNEPYDFVSSDYTAKTGAVFGQVEMPLGARTSLTQGLRFEQRNSSYDDTSNADFSPKYSMLGGAVTLQHDLTDHSQGYFSVSRGYKGGGFNVGPNVPTDLRQYDPEYLWNFELGSKGQFFNRRLQSNVALFFDLRRNQQLKFAYQDDPSDPLSFTYITESVAEGESYGLELENNYQALPWLNLFASGSLLHSEFTSVPPEVSTLTGRAFSVAPAWQYATGVRAELGRGAFTRVEVTGKDSFYFDDSNDQKSNPYSLFNATVGWQDSQWQVLVWSRNLFNQSYDVRGFYFGNEPPDYPNKLYVQRGDPRAFGVTVSYRF
jgi:outer membrane receptor protein involved in Fe transport